MMYSPTIPACMAVPQPVMRMRSTSRSSCGRKIQAAELRRAFLKVEPAAHRVLDRERLLKDFLEHVVGEIAQLRVAGAVIDLADFQALFVVGERFQPVAVAVDRDHVEVAQVGHGLRVGDDGRDVAGQEMFVRADAEDERAAAPRADHQCRAGPRA